MAEAYYADVSPDLLGDLVESTHTAWARVAAVFERYVTDLV